jgi:tetratricopeptide (TPR) repeat protein
MDSMLEWGTPVLYMRSRDGRLFDISTEKRPSEQPLEITDQEELHEHQERRAREKERKERLDTLYAQARRSHQNQDWHAVVDIFEQISKEDQEYTDSEGLLTSAHEALETARKEEESLRQYREVVESAWADGELDSHEVERLRDLADELDLTPSHADEIERTVTGDTKEAILESPKRAAKERYRNVVEEAWADSHVSDADTEQLGALARDLDLSMDTVVDIERDVMGDTKEAILERQEQAAREKEQLDELYARARQSHQDQDWQSVVDLFEQISAEDPDYADPEGLLASAREALDHMRKVADLYDQALRYVHGSEWQRALECLEEVQRLEPGYQDAEELLSRVRQELEPPPTAKIPDLSGQEVAQANSALTSKGLRLGTEREASSDTVPEGQIIEQSLEADTEVEIGSSVSVTVSSGPSTVAVPDLVGKGHAEAESVLRAAGLELGKIVKVSSDDLPEGQIVQQLPVTGGNAERGTSVRVTVAQRRVEEPRTEKPTKGPLSSRPDFLPEELEPRQTVRPSDLPD